MGVSEEKAEVRIREGPSHRQIISVLAYLVGRAPSYSTLEDSLLVVWKEYKKLKETER